VNLAATPEPDADIEMTLVHASIAGMEGQDLRVLALLTTWLGVHHTYVNADRLIRFVAAQESQRVQAYWAAVSRWLACDRRLARLGHAPPGSPIELLPAGNAFQVARHGEDERFAGSCMSVPRGTLRDRTADVLTPEELARHHRGYRHRVLLGPSWRADVWAVLEAAPDLSVAEAARRAGCAFATAWQASRDFRVLQAASRA
jgi:hypothetical protein